MLFRSIGFAPSIAAGKASPRREKSAAAAAVEDAVEATMEEMDPPLSGCCGGGDELAARAGGASVMAPLRWGCGCGGAGRRRLPRSNLDREGEGRVNRGWGSG